MSYMGSIWFHRYTKPCSAMVCGESIIQSRAVVLKIGFVHLRPSEVQVYNTSFDNL